MREDHDAGWMIAGRATYPCIKQACRIAWIAGRYPMNLFAKGTGWLADRAGVSRNFILTGAVCQERQTQQDLPNNLQTGHSAPVSYW